MSRVLPQMLLALLVLALLATSCRREDRTIPEIELQDRIIATANSTGDPTEFAITWFRAPCETFERVEVEPVERFVNLTVKVTVDVDGCPDQNETETIGSTVVNIGEPLGVRKLFDKAFGDTVAVDAPS